MAMQSQWQNTTRNVIQVLHWDWSCLLLFQFTFWLLNRNQPVGWQALVAVKLSCCYSLSNCVARKEQSNLIDKFVAKITCLYHSFHWNHSIPSMDLLYASKQASKQKHSLTCYCFVMKLSC
jgi:hypothetical protein